MSTVEETLAAAESPADVYERCFVPALFRQWGPVVCEAAGIEAGHHVLDVGCGTGALTRAVAARVGAGGRTAGLDANPEMLAVARRGRAGIEWHEGRAEALPFDDRQFHAVVSQFAMMFFDDPAAALREFRRVLRPGGRIAVAVCDAVDRSAGYATLASLLEQLFGRPVADAFRAPFSLGDPAALERICTEADLPGARVERHEGTVRFDSVEALVSTERACVWTLGGLLDDAQFERLLAAARDALRPFVDARGAVAFPMPALIVTGGS